MSGNALSWRLQCLSFSPNFINIFNLLAFYVTDSIRASLGAIGKWKNCSWNRHFQWKQRQFCCASIGNVRHESPISWLRQWLSLGCSWEVGTHVGLYCCSWSISMMYALVSAPLFHIYFFTFSCWNSRSNIAYLLVTFKIDQIAKFTAEN